MEHVAAMLLVLGCADGALDCAPVQERLPQYETAQACDAQIVNEMRGYVEAFEVVLAQCVPVDPAYDAGWELSWTVSSNGMINAMAISAQDPPTLQVASR